MCTCVIMPECKTFPFQTNEHLETTISQWSDFENLFEDNAAWLKDSELNLKDVDLKSTLPEKREQHEKIRVSAFEFRVLLLTDII